MKFGQELDKTSSTGWTCWSPALSSKIGNNVDKIGNLLICWGWGIRYKNLAHFSKVQTYVTHYYIHQKVYSKSYLTQRRRTTWNLEL